MTEPPGSAGSERLQPASEEEAAEMVRAAHDAGRTLALIGGGTKSEIGRPVAADATLTSAGLAGIVAYNPEELVITARAGTPLADIERALAENGQRLAFEPIDHRILLGSSGEPTIGAVAAINNSGPRRIIAGAARDALLGVRFVNGQGQVIRNGGRVMKNVTGLDLVKLMAGSWGTLGFLTEVTFKVLPAPETETTLALDIADDGEAAKAMAHAMASTAEVSGAAHLPEMVAGTLLDRGAVTLLRVEGFADSVADRIGRLKAIYSGVDGMSEIEREQSRALWRDIASAKPFGRDAGKPVWRVSTAPSRGHEFLMGLRMQAAVNAYYDWQGGLIWLCMEGGDVEDGPVRAELNRHGGGHAMLVRARREVRERVPVFQPPAKPVAELSARIRKAFDPKGIFNPGHMMAS